MNIRLFAYFLVVLTLIFGPQMMLFPASSKHKKTTISAVAAMTKLGKSLTDLKTHYESQISLATHSITTLERNNSLPNPNLATIQRALEEAKKILTTLSTTHENHKRTGSGLRIIGLFAADYFARQRALIASLEARYQKLLQKRTMRAVSTPAAVPLPRIVINPLVSNSIRKSPAVKIISTPLVVPRPSHRVKQEHPKEDTSYVTKRRTRPTDAPASVSQRTRIISQANPAQRVLPSHAHSVRVPEQEQKITRYTQSEPDLKRQYVEKEQEDKHEKHQQELVRLTTAAQEDQRRALELEREHKELEAKLRVEHDARFKAQDAHQSQQIEHRQAQDRIRALEAAHTETLEKARRDYEQRATAHHQELTTARAQEQTQREKEKEAHEAQVRLLRQQLTEEQQRSEKRIQDVQAAHAEALRTALLDADQKAATAHQQALIALRAQEDQRQEAQKTHEAEVSQLQQQRAAMQQEMHQRMQTQEIAHKEALAAIRQEMESAQDTMRRSLEIAHAQTLQRAIAETEQKTSAAYQQELTALRAHEHAQRQEAQKAHTIEIHQLRQQLTESQQERDEAQYAAYYADNPLDTENKQLKAKLTALQEKLAKTQEALTLNLRAQESLDRHAHDLRELKLRQQAERNRFEEERQRRRTLAPREQSPTRSTSPKRTLSPSRPAAASLPAPQQPLRLRLQGGPNPRTFRPQKGLFELGSALTSEFFNTLVQRLTPAEQASLRTRVLLAQSAPTTPAIPAPAMMSSSTRPTSSSAASATSIARATPAAAARRSPSSESEIPTSTRPPVFAKATR